MEKIIKFFFVFIFLLSLNSFTAGQIKYIGPIDSCGYMDKKYDSTISYYYRHAGKSSYRVQFMNLHDTGSKHTFYRKQISEDYMTQRLFKYNESASRVERRDHCEHIAAFSVCLGLFSLAINSNEDNNYAAKDISFVTLVSSCAAFVISLALTVNATDKAIKLYNLAQVKKNMGQ